MINIIFDQQFKPIICFIIRLLQFLRVSFLVKKYIIKSVLDSGGGCFPSVGKVVIENGKSVTMSELQKGDRVQTGIDQQVSTTDILFVSATRLIYIDIKI